MNKKQRNNNNDLGFNVINKNIKRKDFNSYKKPSLSKFMILLTQLS